MSSSRTSTAVDHREMVQGDEKEENMAGNVFGRKPGSHGGRVLLLSHREGMKPITVASLSPHANTGS